MPAINTVKNALKGFSAQKAVAIKTLGQDLSRRTVNGCKQARVIHLVFDNVQHFLKQRDLRIGRENRMIIGIACTFIELWVDPSALDVLDKRRRISLNLRKDITINFLLDLIDQRHLRNVYTLQWVEALTNWIPELAIYKKEVALRYRTRCAKFRIPLEKARLHPLATSAKHEAVTTELKDGFLDFLEQVGQTNKRYDERLWFCGGDGMSYNSMLMLKKYLQNHDDSFESFELLQPILQGWHTMWTDLSRIFNTHWGSPLNDNPATLGFAAKKIGRAPPANLKRIDYYPGVQLSNLVHDMHMLDGWR